MVDHINNLIATGKENNDTSGYIKYLDIEGFINGIIEDKRNKKMYKSFMRKLRTKTMFCAGGETYAINMNYYGNEVIVGNHIRTKYPDAVILNALTPEKAWEYCSK